MISIIDQPQAVALAKNPMAITLDTDNYITTPGQKCMVDLDFTGDPVAGETLMLAWNGKTVLFTFVDYMTAPDNSGLQIWTNDFGDYMDDYLGYVRRDIRSNFLLYADFEVEVVNGGMGSAGIRLTAREAGVKYNLAITSTVSGMAVGAQVNGVDEVVRENFKINAYVYLEEVFNSGSFQNIIALQGNVTENQCRFELNEILFSYLKPVLPSYNQTAVSLALDLLKRYYIAFAESYNVPEEVKFVDHDSMGILSVLLAGYSFEKFPGNTFLADYINHANARKFLTTQPRIKDISREQQEYLYFYNNKISGTLELKAKVYFTDGTSSTSVRLSVTGLQKQVYVFPAGFSQLALVGIDPAKTVLSYEIFVSHSTAGTQSEIFTYQVDHNLYENSFYFLFLNSLGGMDTVWCKGSQALNAKFSREFFQKILPADYTVTEAEKEEYNLLFSQEFTVATGFKSKEYIEYLQDFYRSEMVFIIRNSHFLRVNIEAKEMEIGKSGQFQHASTITAIPAHSNKSFTP